MKKWFILILSLVVLVAPVVGCVWLVRTHSWGALPLGLYLAIAFWVFVTSTATMLWQLRLRDPSDPLALDSILMRIEFEGSPVKKAIFHGRLVLGCLVEGLVWPVVFVAVVVMQVRYRALQGQAGSIAFFSNLSLNTPVALVATLTAAMAVGAYWWIVTVDARPSMTLYFICIIAASVMLRHLTYVISTESIATSLRRSLADPYVSMVVLAAADLVTLILAFSAVQSVVAGKDSGASMFAATVMDMLTFERLRAAMTNGASLHMLDYVVSAAGGLYIATGFKSVVKRRDLNRTIDDLHAIAARHLSLGLHREARRWLDQVEQPNSLTFQFYVGAYLAAGDLSNAGQAAQSAVEKNRVGASQIPTEATRIILAALSSVPMSDERRMQAIRRALAMPSADLYLISSVETLNRKQQLSLDALVTEFERDEVKQSHPLTYSVTLMLTAEHDRAIEVLRGVSARSAADEMISLLLLGRYLWLRFCSDPVNADYSHFDQWFGDHVPRLAELSGTLQSDHERLFVLEHVQIVVDLAEGRTLELRAPLEDLSVVLENDMGGGTEMMNSLRALKTAREARRRWLRQRRGADTLYEH